MGHEVSEKEMVLEHRISRVENDMMEMREAIKMIAESLRTLASLEAHHAETRSGLERAFSRIEDIDEKLGVIAVDLPVLKLTSGWIMRGMVGAVAIMGMSIIVMVIK